MITTYHNITVMEARFYGTRALPRKLVSHQPVSASLSTPSCQTNPKLSHSDTDHKNPEGGKKKEKKYIDMKGA